MITGIDLSATVDYVCTKDKTDPTIWKLGALSSRKLARIATDASGNSIDRMVAVCRNGLRGWANFKVSNMDVMFESDDNGVLASILDTIPLDIIVELSTEILKINKFSEQETKN